MGTCYCLQFSEADIVGDAIWNNFIRLRYGFSVAYNGRLEHNTK